MSGSSAQQQFAQQVQAAPRKQDNISECERCKQSFSDGCDLRMHNAELCSSWPCVGYQKAITMRGPIGESDDLGHSGHTRMVTTHLSTSELAQQSLPPATATGGPRHLTTTTTDKDLDILCKIRTPAPGLLPSPLHGSPVTFPLQEVSLPVHRIPPIFFQVVPLLP